MKHLKSFNESSLSNSEAVEIKQYCQDILLELEDIGFIAEIDIPRDLDSDLDIFLSKGSIFTKEDISDAVYSLDEYLKTQGLERLNSFNVCNINLPGLNRSPQFKCVLIYKTNIIELS